MATATDNCDSTVTITFADLVGFEFCPVASVITRSWTATDDCGNTSFCIQLITIEGDTIAPVITCPANITVECTDSTDPADTGIATATDNCDITPTVTYSDVTAAGSCPQEMSITRTWIATDDCVNSSTCVQMITVVDTIAPMITCPPNIAIDCSESTDPMDIGSATATDNCDTLSTITSVM
jgi:hypothetical protein